MTVTYDLTDWRTIVTGSTKGIGAAVAELLAQSGARVVIHGSDETRTAAVARGIPNAVPVAADLAVASARALFCRRALDACEGRVDALIHNAGVFPQGDLKTQTLDEFRRVLSINVEAIFDLTQRLLDGLVRAPQPSVVIVSSAVVRMGLGDSPAYTASKAAEVGLSNHLAAELGPLGIRVNAVLPGLIDTPGTRAARGSTESYAAFAHQRQMLDVLLVPQDIAHPIVFLCSPAARGITAARLDVNAGSAVGF